MRTNPGKRFKPWKYKAARLASANNRAQSPSRGGPEAETKQNFLQRSEELVAVIIRPLPVPDHILRSQTQIVLKNTFRQIQRMKWMKILFDEVDLLQAAPAMKTLWGSFVLVLAAFTGPGLPAD